MDKTLDYLFSYILLFSPIIAFLFALTLKVRVLYAGLFSLCLLPIVISSIRYQAGTDWYAYHDLYVQGIMPDHIEAGYLYLQAFFSQSGVSYNLFLFVLALPWFILSLYPFFCSPKPKFCVSVYLLSLYCLVFLAFIGSRQQVSIAFLFLALAVDSLPFSLTSLIVAFLFHKSVITIPLILLLGVLVSSAASFLPLFRQVGSLLPVHRSISGLLIAAPLLMYLAFVGLSHSDVTAQLVLGFKGEYLIYLENSSVYIRESRSPLVDVLKYSFYAIPVALVCFLGSNDNDTSLPRIFSFKSFSHFSPRNFLARMTRPSSVILQYSAIILFALSSLNPNIGGRLELYLRPLLCLQIATALECVPSTRFRSASCLIIVVLLLLRFYFSLQADDWYVPYSTIFSMG